MTTRAQAPIADAKDRDALSWIVSRIRPDWDRHGINAALAKHPCQELDVLAMQALVAATTRTDQRTPAVLGLDGDHAERARASLSKPASPTSQTPGYTDMGGECGYPGCGVRQGRHKGWGVSAELPPHGWEQPRPITPASPEQIAHVRPEFHRQEQQA